MYGIYIIKPEHARGLADLERFDAGNRTSRKRLAQKLSVNTKLLLYYSDRLDFDFVVDCSYKVMQNEHNEKFISVRRNDNHYELDEIFI